MRLWPRIVPFFLAALAAAGGADAQSALLHEFIPPDAKDDVAFSATTGDGDLIFALSVPAEGRDIFPTSPNAAADLIGTAAADVMVQAILNAAHAATGIPGFPALSDHLSAKR